MHSLQGKRVWVAGHAGMVGQACLRRLARIPDCTVLTVPREALDLRRQAETEDWLSAQRPDAIILAAATVGGIMANDAAPADFLYDNLAIETNVIHAAFRTSVARLLFLGSSCIYPRNAPQPIPERALLTGPLEPTNEAYALAKIAGLKLCEAYRRQHGKAFFAAMPCNLYGPGDTFDAARSHVIPALILTLTAAARTGKDSVTLWGTGAPLREFLFGDDLAAALVFLLDCADPPDLINIGSGKEITIRDLAGMIASLVGYEGEILFDSSKPDGTPRKIVDSARIRAMGWRPDTSLAEGLRQTIDWYRRNFRVE